MTGAEITSPFSKSNRPTGDSEPLTLKSLLAQIKGLYPAPEAETPISALKLSLNSEALPKVRTLRRLAKWPLRLTPVDGLATQTGRLKRLPGCKICGTLRDYKESHRNLLGR